MTPSKVIEVPPCWSVDLKVDRNRARQLLIASQRSRIRLASQIPRITLADGRALRLVTSARGLDAQELALRVPKGYLENAPVAPDATSPAWLGHRQMSTPEAVLASLDDAFQFVEGSDDGTVPGLRVPQLGAVHALIGFWTTGTTEPATVMMPTGTGKTETMVAVLAAIRPTRLLVIVPSDALRTQIAGKFESLGVLQTSGVIGACALRPSTFGVQAAA